MCNCLPSFDVHTCYQYLGVSHNIWYITHPRHHVLSMFFPYPIGSMVLVYILTWLGYIDGIHGTPYIAAPWIRHGIINHGLAKSGVDIKWNMFCCWMIVETSCSFMFFPYVSRCYCKWWGLNLELHFSIFYAWLSQACGWSHLRDAGVSASGDFRSVLVVSWWLAHVGDDSHRIHVWYIYANMTGVPSGKLT